MVIGTENGNTVLSSFLKKKFQQKRIVLEYVEIFLNLKINVSYELMKPYEYRRIDEVIDKNKKREKTKETRKTNKRCFRISFKTTLRKIIFE